jgi:hypothetical protein
MTWLFVGELCAGVRPRQNFTVAQILRHTQSDAMGALRKKNRSDSHQPKDGRPATKHQIRR